MSLKYHDFIQKISKAKKIGIMGGTFDPIHFGHLVAADYARQTFCLDSVIFIPAGSPPHKDYHVTDAEHRYLMTVLATVQSPFFGVSKIEIDSEGPSYTVDTIERIQHLLPDKELFFISGADAILDILTWKNPLDLIEACVFIAATRPGYSFDKLGQVLTSLGLPEERHQQKVLLMEIPSITTSSTEIRKRVGKGESISFLVPENVESYIRKYGLYEDVKR